MAECYQSETDRSCLSQWLNMLEEVEEAINPSKKNSIKCTFSSENQTFYWKTRGKNSYSNLLGHKFFADNTEQALLSCSQTRSTNLQVEIRTPISLFYERKQFLTVATCLELGIHGMKRKERNELGKNHFFSRTKKRREKKNWSFGLIFQEQ